MRGRINSFLDKLSLRYVSKRHVIELFKVRDTGNRFQYQYGRQRDQIMILFIGGKGG